MRVRTSVVAEQPDPTRSQLALLEQAHPPAPGQWVPARQLATALEARPRYVNAAFTAHEVEAITTAHPTPAAHDLTRTWSPQQPRRS